MSDRCWINGRQSHLVEIDNRGLAYGDGVFETILCGGNSPRLIDLHLRRLALGCQRLGLVVSDLEHGLAKAFASIDSDYSIVKIIVVRAEPARGYAYHSDQADAIISVRGIDKPESKLLRIACYAEPISSSPILAGIKHLSRLEHVVAARAAAEQGLDELLLFGLGGQLIEAISSNVLVFHQGQWLTPSISKAGVDGVMKQHIETLLPVKATEISRRILADCDSIALCNAVRGVMPVAEFGDRRLDIQPSLALAQVVENSFSA